MKYRAGDTIVHRSNPKITGTVLHVANDGYLVWWDDYQQEGVQTKKFLERQYELTSGDRG